MWVLYMRLASVNPRLWEAALLSTLADRRSVIVHPASRAMSLGIARTITSWQVVAHYPRLLRCHGVSKKTPYGASNVLPV
jgi:hypothetical protein